MERTYTIPLRKEYQKVPTYKKSKKATKAVKEFVVRHMHAADFNAVKILNELNEAIWVHGIRNPPHKVKVVCKKDDKGIVMVQLFGKPFPEAKKEAPKKGIAAKVAEKVGAAVGKKEEHAGHDHAKQEEPEKKDHKSAPKATVPPAAPAQPHTHAPTPPPVRKNPEQKR